VGTDRRHSSHLSRPGTKERAESPAECFKLSELLTDQLTDVWTWNAARATNGDDLANLVQPQPETLRSLDERDDGYRIITVDAIPGLSPASGRQDVTGLVHAESLAADPATLRNLADQ
jgi:hypothetical protein